MRKYEPVVNRKSELLLEELQLVRLEQFHVDEDGRQLVSVAIDLSSNFQNSLFTEQPRCALAPYKRLMLKVKEGFITKTDMN